MTYAVSPDFSHVQSRATKYRIPNKNRELDLVSVIAPNTSLTLDFGDYVPTVVTQRIKMLQSS